MVAGRKKPRFKPRPCTVEVRDWEGTNHKGTYRIENGDLFVSTGSGSEFVRSSADNEYMAKVVVLELNGLHRHKWPDGWKPER